MMPLGFWAFVGWMILVSLMAVGFIIWGWQSGQFKNVEESKYTMLEDREPAPWPNRKERPSPDAAEKTGGVQ